MRSRRRRDLVLKDIETSGEALLVDASGGRAAVLNETAAIVWLLCDGTRDAAAICREIETALAGRDPALDRDRLARDVERILETFVREGLVEPE